MTADTYPLQVLLLTFSGWINRQQQHVVEYLVEENRVLIVRRFESRAHLPVVELRRAA